jgi:hypothetical protein
MRPVRTISREVAHSWVDPSETTRQGPFLVGKIWSGLYGDMQRSAEMTDPLGHRVSVNPRRAKGSWEVTGLKRNSLSGKFRPARMA